MADLKTVVEETLTRTEPETGKVVVRRRGFFKTQRLQELHAKLKDVRRKLETALGILNHLTVSVLLKERSHEHTTDAYVDSPG